METLVHPWPGGSPCSAASLPLLPATEQPPRCLSFTHHDAPMGRLLLIGNERALTGLHFVPGKHVPAVQADWREDAAPFSDVRRQLDEYFAGRRKSFALDLAPHGTEFQHRVWQALRDIPHGHTWSYAQLARHLGAASAVRAVAAAIGRNRISIIIPCHRVIGSSGRLTGYAGGLERKARLLDIESAEHRPAL